MVQSTGLTYGYTPNYYTNYNNNYTNVSQDDASIMQQSYVSERGNTSTDGNDDGKIGFAQGAGHYIKGATVNFLKGLVGFDQNGKWSFKKLLKNVALTAGAAALHVATGGISTAIIAGAGVINSAGGVVKGAIKASQATTDAEAKDAWEDMGTNTTGLVLSTVGAKAAMKQINPTGNYSGVKGTANAVKDASTKSFDLAGQALKSARTAYKNGGLTGVKNATTNAISNGYSVAKTNFQNLGTTNFFGNLNSNLKSGNFWQTASSSGKINGSLTETSTASAAELEGVELANADESGTDSTVYTQPGYYSTSQTYNPYYDADTMASAIARNLSSNQPYVPSAQDLAFIKQAFG